MHLTAIVAAASDRTIGRDGTLPWHYPEDLKFFKRTTLDHPIVMGRATWDSLPGKLPRREHIVLSRSLTPDQASALGITLCPSLDALPVALAGRQAFLIGGADLFSQLLPSCQALFLTALHQPVPGDAHLPPFEHLFTLTTHLGSFPDYDRALYTRTPGRAR